MPEIQNKRRRQLHSLFVSIVSGRYLRCIKDLLDGERIVQMPRVLGELGVRWAFLARKNAGSVGQSLFSLGAARRRDTGSQALEKLVWDVIHQRRRFAAHLHRTEVDWALLQSKYVF